MIIENLENTKIHYKLQNEKFNNLIVNYLTAKEKKWLITEEWDLLDFIQKFSKVIILKNFPMQFHGISKKNLLDECVNYCVTESFKFINKMTSQGAIIVPYLYWYVLVFTRRQIKKYDSKEISRDSFKKGYNNAW